MKKFLLKLIILCFLSLQSCSGASYQQNIEVNPSASGFTKKVDSIVAKSMNNYNIPGLAIGLVISDSIIYAKGYGLKNMRVLNRFQNTQIFIPLRSVNYLQHKR